MRGCRTVAAVALLCAAAPAAHARPGDLDRSFSKDGKLGFNPHKRGGTVRGLALLDGRRPLLSVQAQRGADVAPTWISLNAAGRVTGRALLPPPAFYAPLISDGYALTEYRHDPAATRYGLSRIGAREAVTLTLEPKATVYAFGVDTQGRAVLRGNLDLHGRVWRFLPDGTPDRSFSGDGRLEIVGGGLVLRPDGGIYLCDGSNLTALDASGNRLARFRHGRVLPPRRNRSQYGLVSHMIPAPGGGLFVIGGGYYEERAWIARLRPGGRLDTTWGDRGYVVRKPALNGASFSTATVDRRGRLLLAGNFLGGEYGFKALIVRLTRGGKIDGRFASDGRKVFRLATVPGVDIEASDIQHVAVDARDRIVLAGNVYDNEYVDREDYGSPYPAIARLKG